MMKLYRKLLLGMAFLTPFVAEAAPQDTVIVYNEAHPLIYEDAWDLWPYVFLNENGEPDGYNIDLLKMIFKELGIPYVIKLKPTLEAQADLKEKKSDLMLRMDANFARNNSSYGKSIIQLFTHSVITPKSQKIRIEQPSDLEKYTIIVHDGSFSHHYIKDHELATNIVAYDDMKEAIQKVSAEDKGIILWNTMSLKWLMQKYQTDNLQLTPFDLPYGEYKFFANDHHLLAQMDSVYSALRANDRLVPIQNKWFYPERKDSGIPSWIWYLISLLSFVAVGFIIYFIIYKVRERETTKEIRKSNDRLSLILETSHVSIWTYDVEKQLFTMMDQHGKPANNYTSLEISQHYSPEDFAKLTIAMKQVVNDQVPSVSLNIAVKESGTKDDIRDYDVVLSVLRRNKKKKPSVIICSKSDTTDDLIRHRKVKDTMLRYQSLFSSAMIDMVYYDKDGYITDMNQKALSALPASIETIRERKISVSDVLGEGNIDINNMELIYLTQIYRSPDDERPLNRYLKRDLMYYELQLMPVRDKKNELIGIYGTGRDVTEIALSHQHLKENTKQLQEANNEITEYIQNIDYVLKTGGISMAKYHLATHTLTIYSEINRERYSLTQTRAMAFVDESSKKQVQRILNRMDNQQTESIFAEVKTVIRQKSKSPLYLQFNFIPTYENGKIIEYFGICRDISELKAMEDKLAKETLRAQEVETVKNAFLRNMSYEIRTPLNTVVGFSELFEMEHSPEDEAIFIQQIKQSSASLLKLINDILFLSRLDAGMITINPKPIDLAGTSEERCERVWGSLKKPGVSYIVRNPYKKLVVEIDDANFSIIMNKIITNAVQYTKSGSVTVGCDYIGDQLYATVEDTGCGISEDAIEHIYERFVTGANTGAGLGLSICHELIEYMGGTIKLKSKKGKGTTVWVTLPCKLIEMERK